MRKITVKSEQIGKRIDKFLAEEFFLYSRGEIIKKIKMGEVSVNKKSVKPGHIIKKGDILEIENFSKKEKNEKLVGNKKILLEVIFENKDIIVVNKQAGIQVHPSYNEKRNTLVNALLEHFPEIASVHDDSADGAFRPGIVHRLDKDTSGIMVVARNKNAFDELKKHFKNRTIEKKYVAICKGIFKEKSGSIKKTLARSADYRRQVIARKNTKTKTRNAITEYKVAKECGNFSVVEVFPKTGRMHQIRVHLSSEGHPVIGDLIYSKKEKNQKKSGKTAKRQLLHAKELKFELFGKKYVFSAKLPQDFEDFLAKDSQD